MDVIAVALHVYKAGLLHFRRLLQREMGDHGFAGILIGLLPHGHTDHENRGLHTVFFQNGIGQRIVALIAVVKGDDHRLFRQLRALLHPCFQVIEGHRRIACIRKGPNLLFKPGNRNDIVPLPLLRQMMVHEDGHLCRIAFLRRSLSRRCTGGIPLCNILSQTLRAVYTVIPKGTGQHHPAYSVPEMGLIIEVPGIIAHRA